MPRLAAIFGTLILGCALVATGEAEEPFPPLFPKSHLFRNALRDRSKPALTQRITGITVPHHLLAVDLIAEAFSRIAGKQYARVVLLSPDHFRRSTTSFAVTRRDFQTALGRLTTDRYAVDRLLASPLVSESQLFSHEHGIQAILPFIAHHFPEAKIVAVAIRDSAKPAEWDSFVNYLAPVITPDTLIVQSTDFSHYLTTAASRMKDQETLRLVGMADPGLIKALSEPAHLDCRAAQYLQMRIQRELFGSTPTVIANHNSQEYSKKPLQETTSYIVQLYSPQPIWIEETNRYFVAGDTFFGRYMANLLAEEQMRARLTDLVLSVTRGDKLIVNLEGVLAESCPCPAHPYELCMKADLSIPMLKSLNVVAVSLANNHSRDRGEEAYQAMMALLASAGIKVLENGTANDLGPFRLAAFTDLDNMGRPGRAVLTDEDFAVLTRLPRDKPLFAFIHWGEEYSDHPSWRERDLAARLQEKGVELVIGCHSHRPSHVKCTSANCEVFSLGNFIFDQSQALNTGKLLEVACFPQGTYSLRLHDIGNVYARLLKRPSSRRQGFSPGR